MNNDKETISLLFILLMIGYTVAITAWVMME